MSYSLVSERVVIVFFGWVLVPLSSSKREYYSSLCLTNPSLNGKKENNA